MATKEVDGLLQVKDAAGDVNVIYPVTKTENVKGGTLTVDCYDDNSDSAIFIDNNEKYPSQLGIRFSHTLNAVELFSKGDGTPLVIDTFRDVDDTLLLNIFDYDNYENSIFIFSDGQLYFQDSYYDTSLSEIVDWCKTAVNNARQGYGYGTCDTVASTALKTVSISDFILRPYGIVSVRFTYDVAAGAKLNVNSTGAKSIYYKGSPITDGIINAGDTATFIYNGSYYHVIAVDSAADSALPVSTAVTLTASGWTGTSAPYTQTVTVSGILEDETKQLIQPTPASASLAAYMTAGVYAGAQAANSLTFSCNAKPTVDLTVYVVYQGVQVG